MKKLSEGALENKFMLGISTLAGIFTIIGGLGIQMNAYLADARTTAETLNIAPIEKVVAVNQPETLSTHVREYFADMPVLSEVARCESEFRQFDSKGHVVRGKADRNDVGIMQINERYHLDRAETLGYDIYTLEGNMAYARYLYETEGTKPWNASRPCWGNAVYGQLAENL